MLSMINIDDDSFNFIKFLIEKGADLKAQDSQGRTCLHYISSYKVQVYDDFDGAKEKRQYELLK